MKKKIILIIIGVILLLIMLKACWPSSRELTFSTQVASENTVQNNVTATGNLEPVDEVEVGTQVSGIVQKLYVDYNSHVTKGQLLAELDKSTLSERLTQANNSVTSQESALKRAQQTYNRTKELYEAKAATQVDMEDAENQLIQAKASLLNAQTQLREAKVNLGYAEIYSPIDGVILSKDIEEGQTVASSFSTPTLFVIAKDLKNMQVEANVDEADIGQVKVGQRCTFTVDAYNGEVFEGTVQSIRLKPITTSNVVTYTVVIHAPNPEEKLYPGMTASISIITRTETALCVPLEAVNFWPSDEVLMMMGKNKSSDTYDNTGDGQTVWVKNGNDMHPVAVETGLDDGVNAIVKQGGIQPGDTIVLSATIHKEEDQRGKGGASFLPGPPRDRRQGGPNR